MAAEADIFLDAEAFLARCGGDDGRHELIAGRPVMMTGGRRAAFALTARLVVLLTLALGRGPCRTFGDGALVRIDDHNLLSPDVFVDCSPFDPEPPWFEQPVLIAEVLSESTEMRDRDVKWRLYRRLPSLQHYLLVSQTERRIEHYAREGDVWRYQDLTGDQVLELAALSVSLALPDVYEGILT